MRLNYFNFRLFDNDSYLLTNDFGYFCFLTQTDFNSLVHGGNPSNIDELKEKGFVIDENQEVFVRSFIPRLQSVKNYLFTSTELFIFVVTKRCNLDCIYCQAKADGKEGTMMTREMAKKAVDTALSSPTKNMNFEFQGGEPLINFDVIKFIVEYTEQNRGNRHITYSLVSNLLLLNDEIIAFIQRYNISLCTSLDGSKTVHDNNRPLVGGVGSYELLKKAIRKVNAAEIPLNAIETTTRNALSHAHELVDEYIDMGFSSIFIRPLTPLGQAEKQWNEIGYTPEEFCQFYRKIIYYIIELNKSGKKIVENHARILLSKIIGGGSENYMELRSPCGAAIGQMAFYHDGFVYTCDEGRMLAEMGDPSFRLGCIGDSYENLICGNSCRAVATASVLESLPGCSDCVYMPYCGVCPVVNYRVGHNIFAKEPKSFRCKTYSGMLDILFELLHSDDYNITNILNDWVGDR